jgi:hypothetical protein
VDSEVLISFRICGPEEPRLNRVLECVHAAVGEVLTLETPGSELVVDSSRESACLSCKSAAAAAAC